MSNTKPLEDLLSARWQELGCHAISMEVLGDMVRVELWMGVDRVVEIHRALMRGEHAKLVSRTDPVEEPLAHALLTIGVPHKHSPSLQHGVFSHGKRRYFMADEAPADVLEKLRETVGLFDGMIAQDPKEHHHAAHDRHDRITPDHMKSEGWRLVFSRGPS